MSEFWHMGGYAFYVWVSYALTLGIVVINWLLPKRCERETLARLRRQARRKETEKTG